jgi:hypothetical protein
MINEAKRFLQKTMRDLNARPETTVTMLKVTLLQAQLAVEAYWNWEDEPDERSPAASSSFLSSMASAAITMASIRSAGSAAACRRVSSLCSRSAS